MLCPLVLLVGLVPAMTVPVSGQAKPGCPSKCGSFDVPYPFGIGQGCYLDESFSVVCRQPNKPLVWSSSISALDISLDGHLRVSLPATYYCLDDAGVEDKFESLYHFSRFAVSDTRNILVAVGCDTYSTLQDSDHKKYMVGCMARCNSTSSVTNGSCSGYGCCQASVPKGVMSFGVKASTLGSGLSSYFRASTVNTCGFAFLVEQGKYRFVLSDISTERKIREYPVVLEWWIGEETCDKARKDKDSFACKSQNSLCHDLDNRQGYRCKCRDGYRGNPYLQNSCQDVDECNDPRLNRCIKPGTCRNIEGSYTCACPNGHHGDGKANGTGCRADPPLWTKIIVGTIISLLMLLLGVTWAYWIIRHRNIIRLREKFFERNGGILLRQHLAKLKGSGETIIQVFSTEDLKKATENYHESRILGQGSQGTVYKGILSPGGQTVAIKKARIGLGSHVEQFINEIIILSQINHRNVVKLLGCCLETEVPLLVYEFVINGSLFDHMHYSRDGSVVPWGIRLKIAVETAGALSYLHSAASIPIIHRDIKSANILLDESYTAKVSDFGASRFIPAEQEQLTTLVQGTLGYLDPEYFTTSHLNEKSDVYSFGVVLMELTTGEKALSLAKSKAERSLAARFVNAVEEDRVFEVLDRRILNDANAEQCQRVADLAMRCVRPKGQDRPTMKEVEWNWNV